MKWREVSDAQDKAQSQPAYVIDDAFIARIHEQAARVPAGFVSTYGIIAELAGYAGAARECGFAMSQAPANSGINAHRIVNATGAMAPDGVFGGHETQRALLEDEGVCFKPDGTVDMQKSVWPTSYAESFRPKRRGNEPDENQLTFDW